MTKNSALMLVTVCLIAIIATMAPTISANCGVGQPCSGSCCSCSNCAGDLASTSCPNGNPSLFKLEASTTISNNVYDCLGAFAPGIECGQISGTSECCLAPYTACPAGVDETAAWDAGCTGYQNGKIQVKSFKSKYCCDGVYQWNNQQYNAPYICSKGVCQNRPNVGQHCSQWNNQQSQQLRNNEYNRG